MNSPKIVKIVIAAVLSIALSFGAITTYSYFFKTAEIPVFNSNPFPVTVAITYEASAGTWETIGWMRLEPGERKSFSATFYRIEPNFFVAAESADQEVMVWLFDGLDKGKMSFSGEDVSIQRKAPKNRAINLEEALSEENEVEFEEVIFSAANPDEPYTLTEPTFHDAALNNQGLSVESEEEGFELIREKAQKLYDSLQRQMSFAQKFVNGKDFPFAFEFTMSDTEDGFKYLGVKLEQVQALTLHGDEVKLQDGDILIGISSQEDDPVTPTYAPADAYYILEKHSLDMENGGITKPLNFFVIRDSELLHIQSYFLFNPQFNWDDETEEKAFLYGIGDTLSLGFLAKIIAFFSNDPNKEWLETQKTYRLKQRYPKATNAGNIAGWLVPLPTKLLKVGSIAKSGRALSSLKTAAKGLSIEFAKLAVYSYQTSVKTPASKNIQSENIKGFLGLENIRMITGNVKNKEIENPVKLKKRASFGQTR